VAGAVAEIILVAAIRVEAAILVAEVVEVAAFWEVSWEVLFSAAGTLVVDIPAAVADIPADEEVIPGAEGVIRAAIRVARETVEMNTNAVIDTSMIWLA